MKEEIGDDHILTRFRNEKTKEEAFNSLMHKYQRDVYYAVRRIVHLHEDANDVTQNVFVKIWRHLDQFKGDSSLKTWISRICVNEALSYIEKKKKLLNLSDDTFPDYLMNVASEDKFFSADKIQQLLQQAIMQLPPKQKIVFTMRYYDETPYEEMSKILDTSESALKASYHFAYKKVEDYLKSH